MEYKKILALTIMAILLLAPIISFAETQTPEPRDEVPEVPVAGVFKLKLPVILTLSVDKAIELAYTIRNLTYDLFQWEIKYNVTAAKIQLERGDVFLNKSLELKDTSPKRAIVFAFVAAIHYSHAPALANPVLGKVIKNNLGENNTITEQTVQVVINTSRELREILLNATEYAKSINVNTTLIEALIVKGDEKITNATSLLESGNITDAFRYAVSGYRLYVRAYHLLVKATFAKYIKELVEESFSNILVEEKVPPAKIAIEKLPGWIREQVKVKIERGEIKNLNETIKELSEKVNVIKEQVEIREKENLKIIVKRILERAKVPAGVISDKELEEIIENLWSKGVRGLDLARQVLQGVREKVIEKAKITIHIPTPPVKPPKKH